jgi:hypothetical protein
MVWLVSVECCYVEEEQGFYEGLGIYIGREDCGLDADILDEQKNPKGTLS